ncbi:MAG: type II secretion system F family protein [Nitrosomonadales bacterium]|nr:type II secretion system F family protein [Nitrosomonadales bacterium]
MAQRTFDLKAYRAPEGLVRLRPEAATLEEAVHQVEAQGYRVVSTGSFTLPTFRLTRPRRFPLTLFSQELLSLLDAGLPLLEGIEILARKERDAAAREVYASLTRQLYEGKSLSQALQAHPDAFPALYIATIRASEKTSDLKSALSRYLVYREQLDGVRKKIVNAAIYPVFLIVVGAAVILFLLAYVIPRFSRVYEELGDDIPAMSRLLMLWGQYFEAHGAWIMVGLLLGVAGAAFLLTRPATRNWLWQRLWRIPAIGEQFKLYQLTRFYRTLGMLLRGGVPLVSAMDMTAGLLIQPSMEADLRAARQRISEGQPIAESLTRCQLTTEVAEGMLRVGERSGNLGEMMERIARFYDEEIARWVEWFTRMFEPLLMIVIGAVIGGIVLLMYMPIFELAGSIQ